MARLSLSVLTSSELVLEGYLGLELILFSSSAFYLLKAWICSWHFSFYFYILNDLPFLCRRFCSFRLCSEGESDRFLPWIWFPFSVLRFIGLCRWFDHQSLFFALWGSLIFCLTPFRLTFCDRPAIHTKAPAL